MAIVSCKTCNKGIGNTFKKCPYCGTKRSWSERHPKLAAFRSPKAALRSWCERHPRFAFLIEFLDIFS